MELDDCAFPLLDEIKVSTDYSSAFKDIDYAFLVGAKPRGPGMERGDLLKDNGNIFVDVGKALNDNAKRECKSIVVGNPANTNCLICSNSAKDMPKENFTAMTRLDHNRALTQLAQRVGKSVTDVKKFTIWGNHSPTMFPDVSFTEIAGKSVKKYSELDEKWLNETFTPVVQKRGAAIIDARGASSAASAANAAIDHMRDWETGNGEDWQSISVNSNGNPYGIAEGLIYSFPCNVSKGKWEIVKGLNVKDDERSWKMMKATEAELLEERAAIEGMLK